MSHFDGIVTSNLVFTAADPDSFAFSILSSSMFMDWICAVGGRLKSDPRFSKTFNYNCFPMPKVGVTLRGQIQSAGLDIQSARSMYPELSLESLYDPDRIPPEVRRAHNELDSLLDDHFGVSKPDTAARQRRLLQLYSEFAV